jgi:hypothetical protein
MTPYIFMKAQLRDAVKTMTGGDHQPFVGGAA